MCLSEGAPLWVCGLVSLPKGSNVCVKWFIEAIGSEVLGGKRRQGCFFELDFWKERIGFFLVDISKELKGWK